MRLTRRGVQCLLLAAAAGWGDRAAEAQEDRSPPASQQMQAVRMHEFGAPSVMRLEPAPRPEPGPGELLVRVHAASDNPVDTGARSGRAQDLVHARFPAELVAEGHIRLIVSHLLPLAEAADAHVQSETRSTRGKIVLEIRS